jgi:hypothetical protein
MLYFSIELAISIVAIKLTVDPEEVWRFTDVAYFAHTCNKNATLCS